MKRSGFATKMVRMIDAADKLVTNIISGKKEIEEAVRDLKGHEPEKDEGAEKK